MKIIKANNKFEIEMSEDEWHEIGSKNEWKKMTLLAQAASPLNESPTIYSVESAVYCLGNVVLNGQTVGLEASTAIVKFSIEIETRSWGVKDIYVKIREISPIQLMDEDLNVVSTITIDPNKIKQEHMDSKRITVGTIDLAILPNLTVDYNKTEINIENSFQTIM